MTTVKVTLPLADGATVAIDRELEYMGMLVGKWWVELHDGDLVVRSAQGGHVEALRVQAS